MPDVILKKGSYVRVAESDGWAVDICDLAPAVTIGDKHVTGADVLNREFNLIEVNAISPGFKVYCVWDGTTLEITDKKLLTSQEDIAVAPLRDATPSEQKTLEELIKEQLKQTEEIALKKAFGRVTEQEEQEQEQKKISAKVLSLRILIKAPSYDSASWLSLQEASESANGLVTVTIPVSIHTPPNQPDEVKEMPRVILNIQAGRYIRVNDSVNIDDLFPEKVLTLHQLQAGDLADPNFDLIKVDTVSHDSKVYFTWKDTRLEMTEEQLASRTVALAPLQDTTQSQREQLKQKQKESSEKQLQFSLPTRLVI